MNIGQSESRSIQTLCSLLGYSRQAFYKFVKHAEKEALQHDLILQEVLRIRKTLKRLGTRKLLFKMEGFMREHHIEIGRDAMFDLLATHKLLIRKRKRRVPVTTFSDHWMRKYPNLIVDFIPTAPNQLWVSDITYITLKDDFAYLSLITDAYSRKIVGFYLSETLSADGCIKALQMALNNNPQLGRLIHHSDRGSQYCCADYVSILDKHFVKISMTQSGDPLENAIAERVNGILKDELLEKIYINYQEAKQAIAAAISIYNYQRPHSSIDMLTPIEAHLREGELKRRWKNYYSKKKEVVMS
ncbi:transposase InsO family protein [Cecembia calidifontis]|jgi:putative transposase|uniref:Transposase InsO family protein n=2 Tax=Cecembia calidifontis TaxID=1187080 RepID=A0A4Q7P614_9BACT|nr:transposase InsO family protein [Cecembia calidifontis]